MFTAVPLLLCGCVVYAPLNLSSPGPGDLEEETVLGKKGPKIAMIEVAGLLSDRDRHKPQLPSLVAEVRNALDRAAKDEQVVGVLLRINTPGGTVAASDTLYHQIELWKRQYQRPVFSFLNGQATSGGYYVAMASDRIIAHPAVLTGSIGVIMTGLSFEGLMDRFGVRDQTLKSGSYKDAGSPFRDMNPVERAQLQSVINTYFARFQDVVAAGRPALARETIATLSDGRVYSAQQALDHGLVDRLGYLEEAVAELNRHLGISESRVVVYKRENQIKENLYSGAPDLPVQTAGWAALLPLGRSDLEPGFYYLWPAALTP
ncbi:MAG: signal peptide peptidase SppA [Nevskiales bacterium]|nr:signal peptide peptidase SppA [Nevskiales bacterium]